LEEKELKQINISLQKKGFVSPFVFKLAAATERALLNTK
jgi:hypothetical protein